MVTHKFYNLKNKRAMRFYERTIAASSTENYYFVSLLALQKCSSGFYFVKFGEELQTATRKLVASCVWISTSKSRELIRDLFVNVNSYVNLSF